jgi:hypothetical protein
MSVITVAGINPILNILGATQQFNYTQPLSLFQVNNSYIPTALVSSQFNMEYRNNLLSGFRWIHLTNDGDTHGSLTLQSFVNAQSSDSGTDIMTITESGNINIDAPVIISTDLDLGNNKIINLDTPTSDKDAVTKAYADSLTAGIVTLIGDITGSGNVGTNITTTFKQDPIFLGNGSLTIPEGTTIQRPVTPTGGMIRYNTNILNFEIYNGTSWLGMGTGSVTSTTAGTGLSGGTITTSGTISIANTAVTAGSYTYGSFTVNAQGQLTDASSNPAGIQASLYMSGNATGTPVSANTFTKVLGTTTQSFASGFTHSNNRFTYNGSTTIGTTVGVDISISHAILVGGATLGVSIVKNGTIQLSAANYELQPTQNAITSLSISSVYATFTNNTDYIEVFVNSTIATTLTVRDMNLSISI